MRVKSALILGLALVSALDAARAQTDTASKPAAPLATPQFQFSDKPDFAVAGIVDYTAAGGHGSDAVLRTSEDLTRATIAQQGGAADKEAPATAASHQHEAELRQAVAATPESYAANHALGEFYLDTARYSQAVPLLERASGLHRGAAEDEYAVALACRGVGDRKQASQHLARALAGADRAEYHRLSGELLESLGDPVSAVEQYQRATQLEPSERNYYAWGSELLLHRAIWQAAEVFQRGVQLHPASAQLKTTWAAALFAGAKYDEAAQQLCAASDLEPASREPYLMMGKLIEGSPAQPPCVSERLARFVQLKPGDAEANYDQAMSLLKQDEPAHHEQAAALLKKARMLDPKLASASLELGILAALLHQQAEAIADLEQAISADPQLAEAHYRLGVLYDRAGRAAEAQRELAVHDALVKTQAAAVEQQRRQVKQFVVTLGDAPSAP